MSIHLMSLLMIHLFCNAVAETGPLSHSEAMHCGANFEELKVLLNPEITMLEFDALPSAERARVSVASYGHYRDWIAENVALVDHLTAQARINAAATGF